MQLARLLENFDPYPAFSRHDAAVNPPIPRRQSRSFLPSAVTRSPLRSNPVGYRDNHPDLLTELAARVKAAGLRMLEKREKPDDTLLAVWTQQIPNCRC
jgi:hypothetical protein